MAEKEFVDSLFESYEKTESISEFKEELCANLNAKIESLVQKGMDRESAFNKASAELGDVSALADELSLKKRTEVFEEVYMDIKKYMKPGRIAGYTIFGALLVLGIIVSFITYFSANNVLDDFNLLMSASLGALIPFWTASVAGFAFLGMSQETSAMYPVSKKRAALYSVAAGLLAFGLSASCVSYFGIKFADIGNELSIAAVLAVIIVLVLPGAIMLAVLVLGEKDRLKPWARHFRENAVRREMEIWKDTDKASRFGIFSGALWIFAVGIFFVLGFSLGFEYAWLVFIFTTGFQILVQGMMHGKKE